MRWWLDQGQHGRSLRRRNRHQPLPRFYACVERDLKPELVEEETKATLLISDVDVDRVHAEERIAYGVLVRRSCHRVIIGAGPVDRRVSHAGLSDWDELAFNRGASNDV